MQSFIFSPIESLLKSCILENSFVSCFLPILNIALCVCACVCGGENGGRVLHMPIHMGMWVHCLAHGPVLEIHQYQICNPTSFHLTF